VGGGRPHHHVIEIIRRSDPERGFEGLSAVGWSSGPSAGRLDGADWSANTRSGATSRRSWPSSVWVETGYAGPATR